jgi:hypothetical protein
MQPLHEITEEDVDREMNLGLSKKVMGSPFVLATLG